MMFTIDEIVQITKGKLVQKQDSFVYNVSTDSRTIQKGDLFIPLQGENFDGHKFIDDVARKGAGCALVSQDISAKPNMTLIRVKNTLQALQDLAFHYRRTQSYKIVGITGSNGKTTTKFFCEAILSAQFKTYASEKSFNNHIGVPLTLLALKPDTEIGIVEIGMNHAGEIANLTELASPDVSLVTTIGRAHLMDFGDSQDIALSKIAKEKSQIYQKANRDNIKIFNLDDKEAKKLFEEFKNYPHVMTFSTDAAANADVQFQLTDMDLESVSFKGTINGVAGEKKIAVFGSQNITNLMGAATVALACGMTPQKIWESMDRCKTVWGRNQLVDLKSGAKLIFDGYNANPDSMKALIENLSELKTNKKKIIILGDMLEMGSQAQSLHEELGTLVAKKNFDLVWFMGQFSKSFEKGMLSVGSHKNLFISDGYEESLAVKVANMIDKADVVVMKGSRGAKLERLVPHFSPLNWK